MTDSRLNPKVDEYLSKAKTWKEESVRLREIILDCGLTEDYKWMHPCYTAQNKNVVIIHGFKEYCALLFHKGALLKDTDGILIQQTNNVQAARQIRFTNVKQIDEMEHLIKAYIHEAVEIEKSGQKVEMKQTAEYAIPEELSQKFDKMPELKTAFEALTPGRQRAYLFYFSDAKQSKTRASRVEKYVKPILEGKGLND
ncbi:YdeI family protein [Paenibacillus sp. MER 99-2]|uniref:YdeI/OmpD-associated family protein n=1 Tax=Paenibacillus sp. MER 99-2 TaxID=2939572 RepID=UPI0020408739|nr:YdeI family protein [Paenibacillus sp. MER 99-2]MCM3176100.1 YdeI family protein [Paenibacillus sp. MER 99-2]